MDRDDAVIVAARYAVKAIVCEGCSRVKLFGEIARDERGRWLCVDVVACRQSQQAAGRLDSRGRALLRDAIRNREYRAARARDAAYLRRNAERIRRLRRAKRGRR